MLVSLQAGIIAALDLPTQNALSLLNLAENQTTRYLEQCSTAVRCQSHVLAQDCPHTLYDQPGFCDGVRVHCWIEGGLQQLFKHWAYLWDDIVKQLHAHHLALPGAGRLVVRR
jgi:hypothetical protein